MHKYFSCDESLFSHTKDHSQVYVLGIIDNTTKDFRLEGTTLSYSETLKNFVKKFVAPGHTIVTDGWLGYSFLEDEGYIHDEHNHGGGDFGFGISSTSHIKSLWHNLKDSITNIYNMIPSRNFVSFLRESEWRIKNRAKKWDDKINEFFLCYQLVSDVEDSVLASNEFLKDSDRDMIL